MIRGETGGGNEGDEDKEKIDYGEREGERRRKRKLIIAVGG